MENKESAYYLGLRNALPIIVSVKISGITNEIELPWDTTGIDVLEAVYCGLCLNNNLKKQNLTCKCIWDSLAIM